MSGVSPEVLSGYAADLSRVADVSGVSTPAGTFVAGELAGPPSAPTGVADGGAFLSVQSSAPLFTDASKEQLRSLHAVPRPAGHSVLFGGTAQYSVDSVESVTSRLPVALGVIAVITFVVLFLATGSLSSATESACAQHAVAHRHLRRASVDLPRRPPWWPWHHGDGHVGRQCAGAHVLHRLRSFHGLRSFRFVSHSRVLADLRSHPRRQRRECRSRRRPYWARRHRCSLADVHLVRSTSDGRCVLHEDVRHRPDDRGVGGRDAGSHAPVARAYARAWPCELVAQRRWPRASPRDAARRR